jgi:hypothetical protein
MSAPASSPDCPVPTSPTPSSIRQRFGRSGSALLLLILLITGACVHQVIKAPKPWGKEVTKRQTEGKELRAKEFGIIGLWWGCAVSAGLSGFLLLSARGWMPGGSNRPRRPAAPPFETNSLFHFSLFIVLGAAVLTRAPQLPHSLWNDEEFAMRRYFHGDWQQAETGGAATFKPATWEETLFGNTSSNNHLLQSALSRLSLETWRLFREKDPEDFSEIAARLPSFIAGIFTVVGVALIGVQIGRQWVGFGAAALLTLHPWHVRYAVEARGYSLMMLFIVIALLALLHALRRDKVLAWFVFALAQAAFLLSFAGSLYIAVALNLLAAMELVRRREWPRLRTLIGFNGLSAIPVLIWMLPSIPQIIDFLKRATILPTPIGLAWARDIGSHLFAGILFNNPEPEVHLGTSWLAQTGSQPLWQPILLYLLPGLAVIGLLLTLLKPSAGRFLVWSIVFGGLLGIAHNALSGQSMLSWYLVYLTLPICLVIPLACYWLMPWPEKTAGPAILLVVALYGLATQDARSRFVQHDRQPIRQTVASYREAHPEALAVVFGVSDRQIESYDPRAIPITTPAELEPLIAQARADKRPLFAVFAGRTASSQRSPDLLTRITSSPDFKAHARHPGLEAMFSYEVWRLQP